MVVEAEPILFYEWIWPALMFFFQMAATLGLVALVGGYLIAAFRYGPLEGGDVTFRMLKRGLGDLISISPRRVTALAWLAVQESLRRRVLVGFAVFLLILLFAGWFLDTRTNDPATLYLSFVLTATTYLVLLMELFLSVFSLPADLKNKTIQTVMTKPVRHGEIVLGRIIGFSLIGTFLLAIMGVFSYFFVVRVLAHSHDVDITSLESVPNSSTDERAGKTTLAQNHRHRVTIGADGRGETNVVHGHWHEVDPRTDGDKVTYVVGPPRDLFMARVPAYGKLRFTDRAGKASSKGISVGKEWTYRSYVAGSTLATANWHFENVSEEQFRTSEGPATSLPIALYLSVFRTHKGKIERGILGSITLRNPDTQLTSHFTTFRAKEFVLHEIDIPRGQFDASDPDSTIDIFEHLVTKDGRIEVIIRCEEEGQYFGMAQADTYLRSRDASFTVNFIKGYLGIWLQMVIVIALGVMFSTLLSAPVTLMATSTSIVMGMFANYIYELADGPEYGGGPVESAVRLLTQRNMTSKLSPGMETTLIETADSVYLFVLWVIISLLPDFTKYNDTTFVAAGFNVPAGLVVQHMFSAAAYVLVVGVIGYFFLKTREVAR